MSFDAALAAVRVDGHRVDALDDLARAALDSGEEAIALEWLRPAAERSNVALLWQWVGLLHRALDEHERALGAFKTASQLAPNDAGIAHGYARVAFEAGLDAVDLFLHARSLAPVDGSVLLGLAAARNAAGEGLRGADELVAALERSPGWVDGYEPLAQLLSTLGERGRATESLERALTRFPRQRELWLALFAINLRREDYAALAGDIARAEAAGIPASAVAFHRAVVAAELDRETWPAALFADAPAEIAEGLQIWRIRHLLRVDEVDSAAALVDQALELGLAAAWPYAATAWRLGGDERREWLEGAPHLVQVFDLTSQLPPLTELAETLRRLHIAKGEYLDQSVRGGTQTDGPLLSRIDPTIRRLRKAIVSAIDAYLGQLPPPDRRHPLLGPRRDRRIRFSGSWSVRLRSSGRHSNHVHPQGWISSALYIALPGRSRDEPANAGWFTLGQPPDDLRLGLDPWQTIQPKPGHLVLFPSWMWHGTIPFARGERLTVAFDVRPPI
ncbi:MAG: putative 2OG-Fe(II) oxygenase [Pseudomonadota bacterium]